MGTDSWQCSFIATFIVLPHWEIRPEAPWANIPLSHVPDTELTSLWPILIMPSTILRSDKNKFDKSLVWLDLEPNSQSPSHEARALPIQPLCSVCHKAYQDEYQLIRVWTNNDFIVLPHWKTRSPVTWLYNPTQSHYPATELTSPCPSQLMRSMRV